MNNELFLTNVKKLKHKTDPSICFPFILLSEVKNDGPALLLNLVMKFIAQKLVPILDPFWFPWHRSYVTAPLDEQTLCIGKDEL